jgi:hypothetical protein
MNLNDAVHAAIDLINSSTANEGNKLKATQMVKKATSVIKLMQGMTNFSLSHRGLAVTR